MPLAFAAWTKKVRATLFNLFSSANLQLVPLQILACLAADDCRQLKTRSHWDWFEEVTAWSCEKWNLSWAQFAGQEVKTDWLQADACPGLPVLTFFFSILILFTCSPNSCDSTKAQIWCRPPPVCIYLVWWAYSCACALGAQASPQGPAWDMMADSWEGHSTWHLHAQGSAYKILLIQKVWGRLQINLSQ